MEKLFNININGSENGFRYGCECVPENEKSIIHNYKYHGGYTTQGYEVIQFKNGDRDVVKNVNVYEYPDNNYFNKNLNQPSGFCLSDLTIYFPDYSVETYENTPCYYLKVSTFINGLEVILCQRIISRIDALAVNGDKFLGNERFFEYYSLKIIDPWYLHYHNDFQTFRNNVKWDSSINQDYNDEDNLLYVELQPVLKEDDYFLNNEKYTGGSNIIKLDDDHDNEMELIVSTDKYELNWNILYNNSYISLYDYIKDTYKFLYAKVYKQKITATITDDEGNYLDLINNVFVYINSNNSLLSNYLEYNNYIISLQNMSWKNYIPGLHFYVSIEFLDNNDEVLFELNSDNLPITPEVFSRLLVIDEVNIPLDDMNIDIVNRIENKIVEVARPEDYDAHVVTPVFIRAKESSYIEIHPKVNEHISLNLDAYKSSVETFILQIEGIEFTEYARTPYGIVFKVIGPTLPQVSLEGIYYVLNEERTLVTTGNYKYIL